jgi:2'-5' RNA ligase
MPNDNEKRLFFALAAEAPWPTVLPEGRLLTPEARHMTLAFLGNVPWEPLQARLSTLPLPTFQVGGAGIVDACLCLPENHPRVIAWHVHWIGESGQEILRYQQQLATYLREAGYAIDQRPFLPHVTLARQPFNAKKWTRAFKTLPVFFPTLHLYESVGNLHYKPIWSHSLIPPFVELSHTADIAFKVAGSSMAQLGQNAQIALCFKCPDLIPYLSPIPADCTLDDLVIILNDAVTRIDMDIGCPFKAVSFHGEVTHDASNVLSWEMIVDV